MLSGEETDKNEKETKNSNTAEEEKKSTTPGMKI